MGGHSWVLYFVKYNTYLYYNIIYYIIPGGVGGAWSIVLLVRWIHHGMIRVLYLAIVPAKSLALV